LCFCSTIRLNPKWLISKKINGVNIMSGLGTRNHSAARDEELVGVASSSILLAAGSNVTFGNAGGPAVTHPIPRYMVANTTGTIITTGFHADDVPVTRNVTQGQVIHFRPAAITGGTAEMILEY
jgi:hypothetical protein